MEQTPSINWSYFEDSLSWSSSRFGRAGDLVGLSGLKVSLVADDDDDDEKGLRWTRIVVTSMEMDRQVCAGVSLGKVASQWDAIPSFFDPGFCHNWATLEGAPDWVKVLVKLSSKVLAPLLYFAEAPQETTASVVAEAGVRVSYFAYGGEAAFWDDVVDVIGWYISSRWREWENLGTGIEERIGCIESDLGVNLAIDSFDALSPVKMLELPGVRRREIRRLVGSLGVDWEFLSVPNLDDPNELQVHRDRFFSRGGDPWLRIPVSGIQRSRYPKLGVQIGDGDLQGLWWWRNVDQWGQELRQLFFDNWEVSALYHEFRYRENRSKIGEPFFKPWSNLNNSARGVLARIWPVKSIGPGRIKRETPLSIAKSRARLAVDSATNIEMITNLVKDAMVEMAAGLSLPEHRNKAPMRRLSDRWRALEHMDRSHFLGDTLTSGERAAVSKLRKEYCEA